MSRKLSYILIGDPKGRDMANKGATPEDIQLSGLYLWARAFSENGSEGKIDVFWREEDLEDFDICHINYTPSNIQLPTVIRDEIGNSSSTKLVMNVDLDVSQMSPSWAYHTTAMVKELKMADHIFHVEPKGAEILSHLLDREVKVNPHPVDVSRLYDCIKNEREPVISTIYHRYTAETMIPYIAQKNVPMRRLLFGYTAGSHHYVANQRMYDQILPYMPFKEHIEEISKSAIGCDMYRGFAYGRAPIEFAGLCIPAVISNTLGCAERLFPHTSVDPFDVKGAESIFLRLINDMDFANEVITTAHKACGYYSLSESYTRFLEMLE